MLKVVALTAISGLLMTSVNSVYADELGVADSFVQATRRDTDEYRSIAANLSIGVYPRSNSRVENSESVEYERLRKYRIIFVPGLVTDVTEKAGRLTGALGLTPADGFLAAFAQQQVWLTQGAVQFEVAPINREGGCDANGDIIARTILNPSDAPVGSSSEKGDELSSSSDKRPVLLITQSKGGADALHGLIRNPAAISKIAAWVAYQPPHAGSTLADILNSSSLISGPSDLILALLKGTGLAYKDMTTAYRSEFNRKYADQIAAITKTIPIVTLVTAERQVGLLEPLRFDKSQTAFLGPAVNLIWKSAPSAALKPNDGIASVEGTCLPGTTCIYRQYIDHFAAVMETAPFRGISRQERVLMFRALTWMAEERVR